MTRRFRIALVLCVTQWPIASPAAQTVQGVVVDSQGRRVPAAAVRVRCGADESSARSRGDGTFTVAASDAGQCVITVRQPGFADYEQALRIGDGNLTVALQLAKISTQVDVIGAAPPDFRSLMSASVDDGFLRLFGGDVQAGIAYIQKRIGAGLEQPALNVDGLPAQLLPAGELISSITVDDDPFSTEHGDGDLHQMQITTRSPDPRWRLAFGAIPLNAGGNNPLAPDIGRRFRSIRVDGGGPLAVLPIAFSASLRASADHQPQISRRPIPGGASTTDGIGYVRTVAPSAALHYSRSSGRFSFSAQGQEIIRHGVVGETLTQPEASLDSVARLLELRGTYEYPSQGMMHRGGIVKFHQGTSAAGATGSAAVEVQGALRGNAPIVARGRDQRSHWLLKHVSEGIHHDWLAGIALGGISGVLTTVSNPFGVYRFESLDAFDRALDGAPLATILWRDGSHTISSAGRSFAAFAQRSIPWTPDKVLRAGVRVDHQTSAGTSLSPRFNLVWRPARTRIAFGGGAFTSNWSIDELVAPIRNRGDGGVWLGRHVPYLPGLIPERPAQRIEAAPTADLAPRQSLATRLTVERQIGTGAIGIEHAWIGSRHLLGWRRRPGADGWLDVIESNRRRSRHELQFSGKARSAAVTLKLNYMIVSSFDDTDGITSFAANYEDLAAEMGPSSSVGRHNASIIADLDGPKQVRTSIVATWRSAVPADIVTGRDPTENGLFLDRPSGQRNTGRGPTFASVDAYTYVPLNLDRLLGRSLTLDISAQLENLLGSRNYIAINTVRESPSFREGISAFPGRTVRISLAVRH